MSDQKTNCRIFVCLSCMKMQCTVETTNQTACHEDCGASRGKLAHEDSLGFIVEIMNRPEMHLQCCLQSSIRALTDYGSGSEIVGLPRLEFFSVLTFGYYRTVCPENCLNDIDMHV